MSLYSVAPLSKQNWILFFYSSLLICCFVTLSKNLFSQEISDTIFWEISKQKSGNSYSQNLSFKGASFSHNEDYPIPFYSRIIELDQSVNSFTVELVQPSFIPMTNSEKELAANFPLSQNITIDSYVKRARGKKIGIIRFLPFKNDPNTSNPLKLVDFKLKFKTSSTSLNHSHSSLQRNKTNSILASGEWYKIAIPRDGVYKITYNFLESLGIDLNSINPQNINIYGNAQGMLPEANNIPRPSDLLINNIYISGESDGVFNRNDYILFYAKGPHTWDYNAKTKTFEHQNHLYANASHYFIGIGVNPPKRIPNSPEPIAPATHTVQSFNDFVSHEQDLNNFIMSGREWFGESFEIETVQNFNLWFNNIDNTSNASAKISLMARIIGGKNLSTSSFITKIGSANILHQSDITSVSGEHNSPFGNFKTNIITFTPTTDKINFQIEFLKSNPSAKGWLNYIEVNARRKLIMTPGQMSFRDIMSVGENNISQFVITNSSNITEIWDVTNPTETKRISFETNEVVEFKSETNVLKEFIAFDGSQFLEPQAKGKILNQNLHSLNNIEYLIVTHPLFISQATELANFHSKEGLTTAVVTTEEVYNEFSSGTPDITAIKDLMKKLYHSTEDKKLKYLLLFGDGSYNNKSSENNTSFILTYQSKESLNPLKSYTSDDYYGLLDPDEGSSEYDLVDIGIGRLPVTNISDAQIAVNKIINYNKPINNSELPKLKFGGWKNDICIIADDEDNNAHLNNAEEIAEIVASKSPAYNVKKIYFDAYQQISTASGELYPEVNREIYNTLTKGSKIVNYIGHGNEGGWGHEAVLDVPTIKSWTNSERLPLFLTATCEFSRFDNPKRQSGGEMVFLNPKGGGIALLTTTRVVFSEDNSILTNNFYRSLLDLENENKTIRLGDLNRMTKNTSASTGLNRRNFTLIGDPAIIFSKKQFEIKTTTINSTPIDEFKDTIMALSNVTVEGLIKDEQGHTRTDFNGVLFAKVYDKTSKIKTLGADENSYPQNFNIQKDIIYNGKITVTNGHFKFSFIVPKDINYSVGNGKFSYYALGNNLEATGFLNNVLVGESLSNVIMDKNGPKIALYLNSKNFVDGANTSENPKLMAELMDENGINTMGVGVGHNISMLLDNRTDKQIELNDFFESDIDTYKSGKIEYQLKDLDEGNHTLKVKAWDIHNNSSESEINFVVVSSENMVLNHVLNYPNPFTTNTTFHFQHNQPNEELNVKIQVFTISGKLVKTINRIFITNAFSGNGINWDGNDDYGDKLGRGTYVYKFTVTSANGKTDHIFEKLVILN